MRFLRFAAGAGLVFSAALSVDAQFRAGMQGTILDASGAIVPQATVSLTNEETGARQESKSTGEGFYRFSSLSPGRYTLTAEATGFRRAVREHIDVRAEQIEGVNLSLTPGQITESVTVTASSVATLETENASVGGTISTPQIQRLPQQGRDPFELLRLTPGVFGLGARNGIGNAVALPNSPGPGGSNNSIFQTENQVPISANGQRVTANSYEIDGVNVNSQAWGGAVVVTPNQESVKEIRVLANAYTAETGRNSGAAVQVVSQNGTNEFHGSGVFKYNSPSLNAYQGWGGPFGGLPQRAQQIIRQYSGSFGGPIIVPKLFNGKNKLFFFFSYETLRNSTNQAVSRWIETPEFVSLLSSARPGSKAATITSYPGMSQQLLGVQSRDCASVQLNPANCTMLPGGLDIGSPTGAIGQNVTDPLGGGLDGIPDLRYAQVTEPTRTTAQQFNGRLDYRPSSNDLIAFSMYLTPFEAHSLPQGRTAQAFLSSRQNMSAALLWTRTITPTLVNEVRMNIARWNFDEISSNPSAPWGIPNVKVSDSPFPFDLQWGIPGAGVFSQTSYDFRDLATKVFGRHALKFGGEVLADQNNDTVASTARPNYSFGNIWNFANDAPINEAGAFDPRNGYPTDLKKYIRTKTYNLFIQDDWKVRPTLTINLGLRWEYFTPLREKFGSISNIVLGTGDNPLQSAWIRIGGDLSRRDRNNFGPQFGFAWNPKSGRTVFRGGFGVGFNRIPQSLLLNGRQNPPFFGNFNLAAEDVVYSLGNDINSFYGWPLNPATILPFDPNTNIPTAGAPADVFGISQNLATPYTYRYSFEIQHNVGADWVASVAYQGSNTHKYPRTVNYSLFFDRNPQLQTVSFVRSDVNSSYNALLARLSRNFSKGYQFSFQYRFAKSLDTCSNDDRCSQTYPFDQRLERGPSDFDVRHYIVASGLWDLPILRNRHDLLGALAGGWQLGGIATFSTGFPWTPVYSGPNCSVVANRGGLCPLRPVAYLGGAGTSSSNDTFQRTGGNFPGSPYDYFVAPPPGTFEAPPPPGIGRNAFRGPRYFGVDLSAQKRFTLWNERSFLDIRANAYNVFNALNLASFDFNSGSTQINSGNFGQATSALLGRIIEFQARFSF